MLTSGIITVRFQAVSMCIDNDISIPSAIPKPLLLALVRHSQSTESNHSIIKQRIDIMTFIFLERRELMLQRVVQDETSIYVLTTTYISIPSAIPKQHDEPLYQLYQLVRSSTVVELEMECNNSHNTATIEIDIVIFITPVSIVETTYMRSNPVESEAKP